VVGDAVHDVKTDAAVLKKSQRFRRTVDEGHQAVLIDSAAAQKPQIGDDLVPRIAVTGRLRQMVLAHPDQPVGMGGAATEGACLFEDERPQAQFVGRQRRGKAGHTGSENDHVRGIARCHRVPSFCRRAPR
jgi:hypothetical protein